MKLGRLDGIGFLGMFICLQIISCGPGPTKVLPPLKSPDGKLAVEFSVSKAGRPQYLVRYADAVVIDTSGMGLILRDSATFLDGFELLGGSRTDHDETWVLPWGERDSVRDHYNAETYELQARNNPARKLRIHFRAFDEGIAFRYEVPAQVGLDAMVLADEATEFNLTADHTCWWIPGDWDSYEHLFNQTKISEIDALSKAHHPNLVASTIPYNAVATPLTLRSEAGLHINIHEAALLDYPEMTLEVDPAKHSFVTELVGRADSMKADLKAGFLSPWRVISIAPTAAKLAESSIILNLNEPSKIADMSWFKPQVYMGIWWEMHLDKARWDMASGKHGATTANAKKYIDFASAHGIHGLLIEGWNTGWEHWIGFPEREGIFDFVTPYADYDLEEVVRYGREKGVDLIMHHETSAAPRTYEQQLDTAYALMERLGIHVAKTGYVGPIIPDGEHHGGQWMVRHYQKTIETAARHKVALDIHEPIKDTGLRRTWPNAIAREGMRGQEFNAWSTDGGNPPSHHTIVPFTCGLAGPLDYTPGIFDIKLKPYKPNNQVNTTIAHQLALYVVIYSPVQMAADLPEHYTDQPAFQFIQDVATDWAETRVLEAVIGDYAIFARRARGTNNWYIGAVTDENARDIEIDFAFLAQGASYKATLYADGSAAHWNDNPTAIAITTQTVSKADRLKIHLAPGGGAALSVVQ
jgi:glucan 1,4-alpha-glucosidase